MGALTKLAASLGCAVLALGASAALADDDDRGYGRDRGGYDDRGYDDRGRGGDWRPERCDHDHDHRSHEPRYYDYYPADRYSRAGDYRGDRYDDRYDRDRYDRDRGRYDDRYGGYGRSRIVKSRVYETRYRARVHLTEEEFHDRRGDHYRICTLEVRGPEARYVPGSVLRRIANNECSRRAEIRIR